ncbi:hypothetical protein GA0111570_102126 [Raineyella antarctica]|uniref:Uncharacterized protein n=1 Tax=Raineyella antarctica TaxID=1577474 RepID=A0A1G6GED6_9ACTN|nr:hypothetical protein [Raineyella antarctica]SDB80337.1 hypothetical protein GA0111570_102126 [Raineyella antarctica]
MALPLPEAVIALVSNHWYDAAASMLAQRSAAPLPGDDCALIDEAGRMATAAKRVLDLDAEDFGTIAAGFEQPWAVALANARFPLEPREPNRGALGSLVPLYELMLEVVQLRSARQESLQVVVTAHLIGEYLGHLAWEGTLGHAGDPARMRASTDGRWGSDDPACPHTSAQRATAKRSLNACDGDVPGYTAYLDRFHSRLGDALSVCAMNHASIAAGDRPDVGETCADPCGFALRPPLEHRRHLDARVRLARIYQDSPIVALRHHAPVGHFFGVPSVAEISDAWLRTWDKLTQQWPDGCNPLLAPDAPRVAVEDEALPGLSALVSAVAQRPLGPGHVIRDIGADAIALLDDPRHR